MILGVDPGLNGAIAAITDAGLLIWDMPVLEVKRHSKTKREVSPSSLAALLDVRHDGVTARHAYVERVGAMPGQGVTSVFSFGYSTGLIIGALAALRIPTTVIPPATWQKAVGKREGKDGSRARAMELYPSAAHFFARVKDDGRADAALIAHYGAHHGLR